MLISCSDVTPKNAHDCCSRQSNCFSDEMDKLPHWQKGASIYDVRTKGGRGVSPKEDVVREVA